MDFELSPAQQDLQARARAMAEADMAPRAAEIDRTEAYPWDQVERLRAGGFLGMTIPKVLGGQGLGYLDAVLVIEEMAKHCGPSARIVVETNMGAIGAIIAYGTIAQQKLAAELVLSGDKPAICITEPGAGSAATQMTTRADKRGDIYVLNGKKHWITGGGVSRLHLVFARVFDERGTEQGIGGFIVVRDPKSGAPKGLIVGKREPAMGLRGIPETELIFDNLEVPAEMLLMPRRSFSHGFSELMDAYNGQRIGAATVALGLAQGAYEKAVIYAGKREQFGRPIAEFQGLQWLLADMSIGLEAARALIYKAACSAPPGGFPDAQMAARAKILAAETAIKVTNDALQMWGAAGYSRDNPMERYVRDARMFAIAGGTAQVLRTLVASSILGRKLPQTRDGYLRMGNGAKAPIAHHDEEKPTTIPIAP
ncbi:MAG TPA: 3-sulfinopropanoyl-CoA desulfinase [Xanthobacteraceae bacterium]|nr:3-sulfinopropanoyl-CoA desulfinase [Xanthobacteraceae bacterium]